MTIPLLRNLITFRRLIAALALCSWCCASQPEPAAFSRIRFAVTTGENLADRTERYIPVKAYLEKCLGVEVDLVQAGDYAGVIEALANNKIELARLGAASYARAWKITGGAVEPLVVELNGDGAKGYHSVLLVRSDSPFQTIHDLKGKRVAFVDPNSTSGYQAPSYFLRKQGYPPDTFFGETVFSGGHEMAILAMLDDSVDAAATAYRSDADSYAAGLVSKGMIPEGSYRIIWKSPQIPNGPFTVRSDMPEALKDKIRQAIIDMKDADPEGWTVLTEGLRSGFVPASHSDYEDVVAMIEVNQRVRRQGTD